LNFGANIKQIFFRGELEDDVEVMEENQTLSTFASLHVFDRYRHSLSFGRQLDIASRVEEGLEG